MEQQLHVDERGDGNTAFTELSPGERMICIISIQRGIIKGDTQPGLPMFEQIMIPFVGLLGTPKACELTHRPQASSIQVRMHSTQERVLPREPYLIKILKFLYILRGVQVFYLDF